MREAVPETEASWWQPFLIRGTDGIRVGGASRVSIRGKWREQRVKDIGRKGHEGGYSRIAGWEGDLEA